MVGLDLKRLVLPSEVVSHYLLSHWVIKSLTLHSHPIIKKINK